MKNAPKIQQPDGKHADSKNKQTPATSDRPKRKGLFIADNERLNTKVARIFTEYFKSFLFLGSGFLGYELKSCV